MTEREFVLFFAFLVACSILFAMRQKFEGDEGLSWEQACADVTQRDWVVPDCDDPLATP